MVIILSQLLPAGWSAGHSKCQIYQHSRIDSNKLTNRSSLIGLCQFVTRALRGAGVARVRVREVSDLVCYDETLAQSRDVAARKLRFWPVSHCTHMGLRSSRSLRLGWLPISALQNLRSNDYTPPSYPPKLPKVLPSPESAQACSWRGLLCRSSGGNNPCQCAPSSGWRSGISAANSFCGGQTQDCNS